MRSSNPSPCVLIILAAGASTRMGRPKQLLPIAGVPLLRRVLVEGIAASVQRVIVVLGANAAEIEPTLDGLAVEIVVNETWAEGMGGSLRAGMQALREPLPTAVIVALADQPGFSRSQVDKLLALQRITGSEIVASMAQGVRMPPALFMRDQFPLLCALAGDQGARFLLRAHPTEIPAVEWDGDDLDSPGDYERYLRGNSGL